MARTPCPRKLGVHVATARHPNRLFEHDPGGRFRNHQFEQNILVDETKNDSVTGLPFEADVTVAMGVRRVKVVQQSDSSSVRSRNNQM